MKLPNCDRDQEVVDALRSGRWSSAWGDDIRRHAEHCAVCGEVALAAQEFQREVELARAELQEPGMRLPSAGLVWWKAQLAARRAAEQRAVAPMVWVERAAVTLGALAALGAGIWKWSLISGWLFGSGASPSTAQSAGTPADSLVGESLHWLARGWTSQSLTPLVIATDAVFLTLMIFAAYVVWREE